MQADLAASLEAIAKDGPRVLYEGELGRAIVDGVRASGGILAEEDLRGYSAQEGAPLETLTRSFCWACWQRVPGHWLE